MRFLIGEPQRRYSRRKKLAVPNWIAGYIYHIASVTGWGYREIRKLPITAGLQIMDADLYAKGIQRVYRNTGPSFDSMRLIDEAFAKLKP